MPLFPHLTISIFFTRLFIRLVNSREERVSLYIIFSFSVPYLLLVCKIYRQRYKNPTKKINSSEVHVRVMHVSSACPWGRTQGQPGEYVGEYKGMNWLLCPWAGENSRHCFEFEGKGWGNSKFCKITDANHGDIRGICRFPQPINNKLL